MQITGLELENVKTHIEQKKVLLNHLGALKKSNRYFSNVPLVFIPENNLGLEASHMEGMVQRNQHYPEVIIYKDQRTGKTGVCKTESLTSTYQVDTESKLLCDQILISEYFVTTSKQYRNNPGKILEELKKQMKQYQWRYKDAPDEFGKRKTVLTGKVGGEQDDAVIALMMLVTWSQMFMHNRRIHDPAYVQASRMTKKSKL